MNDYNTEVWKDVKDYEGIFQVSNFGRVKSMSRLITYKDGRSYTSKEKLMSPVLNSDGYPCTHFKVSGEGRTVRIHRLVAQAFVDNPYDYDEVNHIDEDKTNNHYCNLEWCTRKENMNHGTLWERVWKHPNQIKAREDSKSPIIAVNIDTEKELRFSSINEADSQGFKRRNIWAVLNGSDKSHKGYVWFRESEYNEQLKENALKHFRIKIKQLNDDGVLINVFDDMKQAGESVGVHPSNISRAVNKGRKCKGYKWIRE